jgi:ribosomal protein L16 Arg81 hydroxylase
MSEAKTKQVRLVEAAGVELEALLHPVTPASFVSEYWGKKPLYVKGFRDKFKGFFDGPALTHAIANPGNASPDHLHASFDKKGAGQAQARPKPASNEPEDVARTFPIPPEMAGTLFDAGATLCLTDVHARVPRLAHFVAAIKRQLGYPGRVAFAAYLSPAGAGFNWHFDGRIASTLQIEGSKRWRFSNRPALDWPRGNGVLLSDGSARYGDSKTHPREAWERLEPLDKKRVTEVNLEPGDLLILPAGTWHDAAGGSTGSLALNLSFTPVSYTSLVGDLLDALLAQNAGWRSPTPLLSVPGGAPWEVDPRGLEAISTQLAAAAEALRAMSADSAAMVKLWSAFVQNASPPIPLAPSIAGRIAEEDRFRLRADGNVYVRDVRDVDGGTKLSVTIGSRSTEAGGPAQRFLRRALLAKEFAAGDCLAWGEAGVRLAWGDVEQFLAHLVAEGLLERAPAR